MQGLELGGLERKLLGCARGVPIWEHPFPGTSCLFPFRIIPSFPEPLHPRLGLRAQGKPCGAGTEGIPQGVCRPGLQGGWAAPRKQEGPEEALRYPDGNRIHHGASARAAATDVWCQPILSPQPFPGISSADTLRIHWGVGAGSRPSDCSVTLCRCVEKMSWGRVGL